MLTVNINEPRCHFTHLSERIGLTVDLYLGTGGRNFSGNNELAFL